MNPEQFNQLVQLAERIANKQFAITAASDWPILAAVGTILGAIIAFMWIDLKSVIREGKDEWRSSLKESKDENSREHETIWKAMRDCKEDCCLSVKKNV